ncbi:MAG: DUF1800 family protein [Pirellulales bacterium]
MKVEIPTSVGAGQGARGGTTEILRASGDPWAPYRPGRDRPWNPKLAGHLIRRATFGANWRQLQQTLADGPQRAIDRLLSPAADVEAFNRKFDAFETTTTGSESASELRAWWLRRMIETPHPLLEKITLFWHGHFGISNHQVHNASLMQRHVATLRKHALGRFDQLAHHVVHAPSLFLALDARAHRKAQPNHRFARGLLGTFGLEHAAEEDIDAIARAFTGWFVLRGNLRFLPREHDGGVKRIFGQEGRFKSEDAMRIVLQQPAASRQVVGQLYRWLISEAERPDNRNLSQDHVGGPPRPGKDAARSSFATGSKLVQPLATTFAQDFDIARLVATLLRSNVFFSSQAYRQRIKSPIEMALGIVQGLENDIPTVPLAHDMAALGQNLYHPPTTRGWVSGRDWIDAATLCGRSQLAFALLGDTDRYGKRLDAETIARKHGFRTPRSATRFLVDLFLQGDLDDDVRDLLIRDVAPHGQTADTIRELAHTIVTLPEYQLS